MTLPSAGSLSVSQVNSELGRGATWATDLGWLNGIVHPDIRPSQPNMARFYGLSYYQNNAKGNCNNGNCNCSGNCGNIQCSQCYSSQCVNCANCDGQAWLQGNCNCACTYNCNANLTSYNCNCNCACSKIICTKLYQFGMMDENIFVADQKYGEWLRRNDRNVYKGYIKWARIVTSWMDGKGPDFMFWIGDKTLRSEKQKAAATKWAYKIATPWSRHMAFLMSELKEDDTEGRVIMGIGRQICKVVNKLPKREDVGYGTTLTMWGFFLTSYVAAKTYGKLSRLFGKN